MCFNNNNKKFQGRYANMEALDKRNVSANKLKSEQNEVVPNMLDTSIAFKQFCSLPQRERSLLNNTMHVMVCDMHPLNKKQ